MLAQIKAACLENSNLLELAVCSGESHCDGRRIILQRQFSNWKGEGYSCSSPGTVTKWVPIYIAPCLRLQGWDDTT